MDKVSKTFIARVKARMAVLNINQAELARRLNVPASNVSHYLAGSRTPGSDLIQRYAIALETTASALLDPNDSVTPLREPTNEELLSRVAQRMGIDPRKERMIQVLLKADDLLVETLEAAFVPHFPVAKDKKSSAG